MTRLVLFELFLTNYCLCTNKKLLVSWQFPGPCGVTKYGSGWRKDVVNQCLEFVSNATAKGRWTWTEVYWHAYQNKREATMPKKDPAVKQKKKDTRTQVCARAGVTKPNSRPIFTSLTNVGMSLALLWSQISVNCCHRHMRTTPCCPAATLWSVSEHFSYHAVRRGDKLAPTTARWTGVQTPSPSKNNYY